MFKLKYRNSVSTVEVSFDEYMDLVYYVAANKIQDADVVSITLFGQQFDMTGLYDMVKEKIENFKIAEDESMDVEELDWKGEEEPEEIEEEEVEEDADYEEGEFNQEIQDQIQSIIDDFMNI